MLLSNLHPNEGQIEGVPANPRSITEKDFQDLRRSVREFSKMMALRPIIVDENNDILGGNMRYRALCRLRDEKAVIEVFDAQGNQTYYRFTDEIPDKWVNKVTDLTPAEKREFLIKDNIEKGQWDLDMLANEWEGFELGDWGLDLTALMPPAEEEAEQVEENTSKDDGFDEDEETIPQRAGTGDIWVLGNHRLLVGDSCRPENIARLVGGKLTKDKKGRTIIEGGQRIDLWLTDPPYNVAVSNSNGLKIANDNMASEDFGEFLQEAFAAAELSLRPGASFYVWFASCEHINFETALNKCGLKVRQEIVWNKNSLVLGRQSYQWKHEPCLFGWKDGEGHYFINSRKEVSVIPDEFQGGVDKMSKQELRDFVKRLMKDNEYTTVMDFNKPTRDHEHPTMKPVELFGYLVRNSSKRGDAVLDTFGGSGTTMIACEQLGRKCYMTELDPHYADVIIARWEKLTGCEAYREEK